MAEGVGEICLGVTLSCSGCQARICLVMLTLDFTQLNHAIFSLSRLLSTEWTTTDLPMQMSMSIFERFRVAIYERFDNKVKYSRVRFFLKVRPKILCRKKALSHTQEQEAAKKLTTHDIEVTAHVYLDMESRGGSPLYFLPI